MDMIKRIYHKIRSIVSHYIQYHIQFRRIQYKQKQILTEIKKKDKISVMFFAMNLPMWRYQSLYEAMLKHERFNAYIVLSPCISSQKNNK